MSVLQEPALSRALDAFRSWWRGPNRWTQKERSMRGAFLAGYAASKSEPAPKLEVEALLMTALTSIATRQARAVLPWTHGTVWAEEIAERYCIGDNRIYARDDIQSAIDRAVATERAMWAEERGRLIGERDGASEAARMMQDRLQRLIADNARALLARKGE